MSLGLGEIIIILLIAYLVVGPEDLPKMARKLAKFMRQTKVVLTGWEDDIQLKNEIKDIKQELTPTDVQDINLKKDLSSIQKELEKNFKP